MGSLLPSPLSSVYSPLSSATNPAMKCVIILTLIAFAAAQQQHHPGDALHHLIHAEVQEILGSNDGISVSDCTTKCDALFDLAAGHDEQMTDDICGKECDMQVNGHHHTHPTGH